MKIQIQDLTPYQDCLRWDIQTHYYQTRGLDAFKEKEIPFYITSNYRAARQKAEVVLSALGTMHVSPDEPIQVLETGGGSGLFAAHFIQAWDDLCSQQQLDYRDRLHYLLSDFSRSSLESLVARPHFAALVTQGRLGCYVMDALNPCEGETLSGQPYRIEPGSLVASISNYNHCTLPAAILRHDRGQFFERHVKLFYWPLGNPDKQQFKDVQDIELITEFAKELEKLRQTVPALLADAEPFVLGTFYDCIDLLLVRLSDPQVQEWAKNLKRTELYTYLHQMVYREVVINFAKRMGGNTPVLAALHQMADRAKEPELLTDLPLYHESKLAYYQQQFIEDEAHYVPIDLAPYLADPIAQKVLTEIAAQIPQATILYAFGSLSAIRYVMPLLRQGGLLLISDKAQPSTEYMAGHNDCPITVHGNSFAHDANFPLMVRYAQALGYDAIQTQSRYNSLQTLLVVANPTLSDTVAAAFQHHYVDNNHNLILCDLVTACKRLRHFKHLEDAAHTCMGLLKYDSRNSEALYTLASYHLSLQDFKQALYYLAKPHDDYLGLYNFAYLKGQALMGLKHYTAARDYFDQTLLQDAKNTNVWYALIECYVATSDLPAAWQTLQKALSVSPEDPVLLSEWLIHIKQKVIEQWQAGQLELLPSAADLHPQEVLIR